MRTLTGGILVAVFVAIGSGVVQFLHLQEHAIAPAAAAVSHSPQHQQPAHDEDNCLSCLTLHLQYSGGYLMPLLACLGLAVAFLTLLAPRLTPQALPARIDCRGPPSR